MRIANIQLTIGIIMDFIREKIKEKPINKRRLFVKLLVALLCGLVFALTVCVMLLFLLPKLGEFFASKNSEQIGIIDSQEITESEYNSEGFVIPPDFNLSISDYQSLQNELYRIGNEVNKSIVVVSSGKNWMENSFEMGAQGSGTIIGSDSYYLYILTEMKDIIDVENICVTFIDQTIADAKILKQDSNTGLVILTVETRLLKAKTKNAIAAAKLGSSYTVQNGALVIALGSPLGTSHSIVTGNITSIDHEISIPDRNCSVYTTDIAGNEQSSGVLVNIRGEVIGIVMQMYSGSQRGNTLTAVPIEELNEVVTLLQNRRDIPYIGIYVSTVTSEISEEYDIPKGVYIKEVVSDSPAMKAGLQSGDVITHINGEVVNADDIYSNKLLQLIPGTTCEISLKRQNGDDYYKVTCEVTVGIMDYM